MEKLKAQRTRVVAKAVREVESMARMAAERLVPHYGSAFPGPGVRTAGVRRHVRGDDSREIDPTVTARTGAPHVKVAAAERGLTLLLIVDLSCSGPYGSGRSSKRVLAA